jgi:crotonobetainyl-CoA:carnitine CoA-transferase CaiB-like acyl-CoA transferase
MLDLKKPQGLDIVRELIPQVDIVVQAFTPGVMDRLGLGYESLCKLNPKIILCSVSGFGQTGPNANRLGYAHLSHGMTTWLAMQFLRRTPPEIPRGPGSGISDLMAGVSAFGASDAAAQTALLGDPVGVWYHPVHAALDGSVTATVGPDLRT